MGRSRMIHFTQADTMPEYEKLKLKTLQYNATRMKDAYGENSIANKILHASSKSYPKHLVDVESSKEGTNKSHDKDPKQQNENQEKNQGMRQTLPMLKFAMLKSEKAKQLGKKDPQSKNHELRRQDQTNSSKHCQQKNPMLVQAMQKQKQNPQIRYCSPGSLASYSKMRERQQERGRHANDLEYELPDFEEQADILTDSANNFETELSRDENHLVSSYVNRMENGNDEEHNPCLPMENESSIPSATKAKKHRGQTTMIEVHQRTPEEREMIILNEFGQPIGPTRQVVTEFSRFLGTVANNPNLVPFNVHNWIYVPRKDKIWEYVKERYIIPPEGEEWVMDTIASLWRVHKSRLKKNHYYAYETDEERLAMRPPNIPINQFEELLEYWGSKMVEETSKRNKRSRSMLDDNHTMGSSTFALLRHELQQKDPNKRPPTRAKIYQESRKRVPGRVYKTKNDKSMENIEKMNALQSEYDKNGEGNNSKDPYCEVVPNGRLHLFGRSVTKSKLKEKEKAKSPSYILPPEFLQSIKADLIQQSAPDLISLLASKIQEANPDVELVIPEITINPRDVSSATSSQPNEQPHDDSALQGDEEHIECSE